jgi:ssDNA-binding Zn-finger/Zn-ribbon topoisomerase 1
MFDNAKMLDLVEHALEEERICPVCSAPTTIAEDNGRLWLVCSATPAPTGILARMTNAILPHERRLVADLRHHRAA